MSTYQADGKQKHQIENEKKRNVKTWTQVWGVGTHKGTYGND